MSSMKAKQIHKSAVPAQPKKSAAKDSANKVRFAVKHPGAKSQDSDAVEPILNPWGGRNSVVEVDLLDPLPS